jgi:DNA-binding NarL/FixJ family response regulator
VTFLLAHRHPLVREGLKTVLGRQEDWRVIGETDNGLDTIRLADHLSPDVLIVDARLPRLNGLEVTRHVRQRRPHTSVLVLSASTDVTMALEALRQGATGSLLTEARVSELIQAVQAVAVGRRFVSAALDERLETLQQQSARPEDTPVSSRIPVSSATVKA